MQVSVLCFGRKKFIGSKHFAALMEALCALNTLLPPRFREYFEYGAGFFMALLYLKNCTDIPGNQGAVLSCLEWGNRIMALRKLVFAAKLLCCSGPELHIATALI